MKLYFTDAFTKKKLSGNPAPVVCDTGSISAADMQKIAKELNASETIFVSDSKVADFKVRFFTPKHEVDLCGHGTVGAFWVLASTGRIRNVHSITQVTQETKAGILPVDIYFSPSGVVQRIMMHQRCPTFSDPLLDRARIAEILKVPTSAIMADLPILNVSTGRAKLMVPVRNQDALYAAAPDFGQMTGLCKEIKTNGFHVFTFQTHHPASVTTARHFAPTAGVNEDVVTGNAAGALGCYLVKHCPELAPPRNTYRFVMEQGHNFGRDGEVHVEIEQEKDQITTVRVGGTATILFATDWSLDDEAET